MLIDIIELRFRKWVTRTQVAAPKTIPEDYQMSERDRQVVVREAVLRQTGGRDHSRIPSQVGQDGWSTPVRHPPVPGLIGSARMDLPPPIPTSSIPAPSQTPMQGVPPGMMNMPPGQVSHHTPLPQHAQGGRSHSRSFSQPPSEARPPTGMGRSATTTVSSPIKVHFQLEGKANGMGYDGGTINANPSQPASTLTLQSESTMAPSSIEPSKREFVITSPTLEELMRQKMPKDLTDQVTVPDFRRPAHGGCATVHKGEWNDRTVAVKVLKAMKNFKKPARWEASMERRLSREIRVWAALSHPNIAEFLGFADDFGDFTAMISTWCHQGTANDYLSENENITKQGRIHLVQDVAHGLKYLHRLRIIHGDLKPTNVLIDDNHVARLCDFGLVRLDDWQGPGGMTTPSPYGGTERYKAPELFISINNPHPKATSEGDIYALGCVTLESQLPYERYNHSYQLVKAIEEGEPPAPRPKGQSDTGASRDLWYILEACWKSDPEDRAKVDEVVDDLAHFSEALSTVYTDLDEADRNSK